MDTLVESKIRLEIGTANRTETPGKEHVAKSLESVTAFMQPMQELVAF